MEKLELPKNWGVLRLDSLADIAAGYGFPKKYQGHTNLPIPFIKVSDMNLPGNELFIQRAANSVDRDILSLVKAHTYPQGTIIFPKIGGAIATNKKRILSIESTFDNNVMGLTPNNTLIEPMWLFYFLMTVDLMQLANIGPIPSIRQTAVQALLVPIPHPSTPTISLEIQRRIVLRLESLLAEIKSARDLQEKIEEDSNLVIETARHEVFTALAKKSDIQKFEEVADSRLGKMLSEVSKTGKYSRPYLRNANVLWDAFNLSDVSEMDFAPEEREKYSLQPGDLLICEGGDIGRSAVWEGQIPECYYQKALHRVRLRDPQGSPRYLMHYMAWSSKNGSIAKLKTGAAIPHLTGASLKTLDVIWVDPTDQKRIVAYLDSISGESKELQKGNQENTELITQMEQSVLAQAFRGEL